MRTWSGPLLLFLVLLPNIFLISCGGAGPSGSSLSVTVTVLPVSAQPFTGSTVSFTATVQNSGNATVNWQVNSIPDGNTTFGTIDSSGVYTAPNAVPNPPTVIVTAVLGSDPTRNASSNVTIQSQSSIQGPLSISPALSSLTTSQTLQLHVTTAGLGNSQVNWAVSGGTITTDGLYTPPSATGSFSVIVKLKTNPSVIGSAQIKVTDFAGMFTWRNDNSRSGRNTQELALTPASVGSSTFGKLSSCPVDGYAYAQPLYVADLAVSGFGIRNVVIVATEKDSVFAFDADANPCVQLWQKNLIHSGEGPVPVPNLEITIGNISPFIGITGTPVIDLRSSTLYVVAETWTPGLNPIYHQRLYALDLASGQPKIDPSGVEISATPSGAPAFSPLWENQRAALLLENGTVYIAFASYQDQGNYHGWLLGYDASTLRQTFAFDDTPAGQGGGIWQSGGGPSADSNHNVFVVTGNGTFDAGSNGSISNYGDSILRLSSTNDLLTVTDIFTPCNQATAGTDLGLGSSAPLLLPDGVGPRSYPNLLLGAAENGSMYLVDRYALSDGVTCPDSPPHPVQEVPVGDGPILSTPLFWDNAIYVAAGNGKLKEFSMAVGVLQPTPSSQSPETLGQQGATPVVSSNGTNNVTAIVWLIDTSGAQVTPNTPAILRAFDAKGVSNEIYNSAMALDRDSAGLAVKFTVPTVANGKVYVGTQTKLDVYGLLH
jgi:hypothetical protein